MSDRPSDGMGLDELREEFDWISEFQSRMAERIRGDADVHNLVDYVGKLEAENAKLRELLQNALVVMDNNCGECAYYDECNVASDLKCVASKRIRAELSSIGIEV